MTLPIAKARGFTGLCDKILKFFVDFYLLKC
nr:MAG TPA: hypothetical protein [Bacteriophage sp.]